LLTAVFLPPEGPDVAELLATPAVLVGAVIDDGTVGAVFLPPELLATPAELVGAVIDDDTGGALLEEEEFESAVDTMVGNPMSSLNTCDCPSFSMVPPRRQTESASKHKALRRTRTLRNAILLPLLTT
jgi:hypothetical protein